MKTEPSWPTVNEEFTGVPQDLIDLSMHYCLNESFTPAHTVTTKVPKVQIQRIRVDGKWVEVGRTTIMVDRTRNVAEARRISPTSGRPFLNELIQIVNTAKGHLVYRGRNGNTWHWHKKGLRFTDPEGVRQDIPPHDITVTLLADGRFELRYSHNRMVQYAAKFNPETTLTSFLPHIEVQDGVAYNRTLINGKPWNEVNIRSLMTSWGKANQDYVWRWWTYGDTGLNTTDGHRYVDGWATSITQYPRTDERGHRLNVVKGGQGSFDAATHTFTYPDYNGNPVYIMLQAEFLPAQHKQAEFRSYHLFYPHGLTPEGSGFLWPVKPFDPNQETY